MLRARQLRHLFWILVAGGLAFCSNLYSIVFVCVYSWSVLVTLMSHVRKQRRMSLIQLNRRKLTCGCHTSIWWNISYFFAFLGWLFDRVDLIKPVSNVIPSVCAYVRTYVRAAYVRPSTKSFFDFSEIWYVGRCRWVMHDVMQYDPI